MKMEIIATLLLAGGELLVGILEVVGDGIVTLLVRTFSHKKQRQQNPTQE